MKRRGFAALVASGALATVARRTGAQLQRSPRIGILTPVVQPRVPELLRALSTLGWQPGRNLEVEVRSADNAIERFDALAAELVRMPVDLLVTVQTPAAHAARRATTSLPIVMSGVAEDPVRSGLVESLARPGGNVTGIFGLGADLAAKALELVRELRTPTQRVGVLSNATDPFTPSLLDMLAAAARTLEIELQVVKAATTGRYDAAFAAWSAAGIDAVFVQPSLALPQAIASAMSHRLPSFSFVTTFALAGGLLSYSVDSRETVLRTAYFVDRILKGASPADLPVEQPSKFELIINLRTAGKLGLTIPRSLRLRADRLVE